MLSSYCCTLKIGNKTTPALVLLLIPLTHFALDLSEPFFSLPWQPRSGRCCSASGMFMLKVRHAALNSQCTECTAVSDINMMLKSWQSRDSLPFYEPVLFFLKNLDVGSNSKKKFKPLTVKGKTVWNITVCALVDEIVTPLWVSHSDWMEPPEIRVCRTIM